MKNAPSLELKVPPGGYGCITTILSEKNVNNHYGTEQPPSHEVSWKDISHIIRAQALRQKIIEASRFRYANISMFDPEYELLLEDYLEELDEQGV